MIAHVNPDHQYDNCQRHFQGYAFDRFGVHRSSLRPVPRISEPDGPILFSSSQGEEPIAISLRLGSLRAPRRE